MRAPTEFKAVPFDPVWIDHAKVDIHAIYRRPVLDDRGRQIMEDGLPKWDLTGGLPVRRHRDWLRKGFRYVTLANHQSLADEIVQRGLRARGLNPDDFVMLRGELVGRCPWNPELYMRCQVEVERREMDQLRTLLERFGSDAVVEIKRLEDPTFELPEPLRRTVAAAK